MSTTLYPWHQKIFADWHVLSHPAHAYLVVAPADTGGEALLHTLAASVLCENKTTDGLPCGTCTGCQLNSAHSHPDLRILRPSILDMANAIEETRPEKPSKLITIEQVRGLANMVNQTSHRGGKRVVLVYPAQRLNASAANALLKTLEEPTPHTQFFLLTHDVKQLLPTIISRCQRLNAPAPDASAAIDYLTQNMGADASWPQRLAAESNAVLRVAELHATDYFEQQHQFISELAKGKHINALRLAEQLEKTIKAAEKERLSGEPRRMDMAVVITWLQRWLHDLTLAAQGVEDARYFPNEQTTLSTLAQSIAVDKLHLWQQQLLKEQRNAEHPLNIKLWLEKLLLQYSQLF